MKTNIIKFDLMKTSTESLSLFVMYLSDLKTFILKTKSTNTNRKRCKML